MQTDVLSLMQDPLTEYADPLADILPTTPAMSEPSDMFWDFEDSPSPYETEVVGPVEAGFNASQMMLWEGLESVAQAAGMDVPEWLQGRIDENEGIVASANLEDFGDKLAFAGGQLLPVIGGTLAAAAVAPFVGMSASVGSVVAGTLAGMGMTVGDLQGKAKDLAAEKGETHEATVSQVATGLAIGSLDMFAINRAKHLAAPIADLVKDSVLRDLKTAKGVTGTLAKIGKDSLTIGAAEGAQDIATSVGANFFTDTDIDMSRVNAIARSAAEEAAIGTILGVPLTTVHQATGKIAENQRKAIDKEVEEIRREQAANAQYQAEVGGDSNIWDTTDDAGTFNEEAINYVPVKDSAKNPGLFSRAFNVLVGNITDPIKARHGNNPHVQLLMQQINLRPSERKPGRTTVSELANPLKGTVKYEIGAAFWDASRSEQDAAVERKAAGEMDLSNPVDEALYNMLHSDKVKNIVAEYSFGNIDPTKGKWNDNTYFPIANSVDFGRVQEDVNWRLTLADAMAEAGKSEKDIKKTVKAVEKKIKDYNEFGNDLSEASQRATSYEMAWRNLLNDPNLTRSKKKKAIAELRNKNKDMGVKQESALTLDRLLRDAPQSWLNANRRKGISNAQILGEHIDKNMEHLAHIKKFGFEDSVFYDQVAEAIKWGEKNGNPLKAKDINDMFDALRVSKRMHLKPIDRKWRERQATTRALVSTNLLGLSALVSIPEMLSIPLNTSIRSALKAAYDGLTPQNRRLIHVRQMNESLHSALQHVANRTNQDTMNMRAWEQWFIQNLTGLPQMQYFLTSWAAKAMDAEARDLITKSQSSDIGEANAAIVELNRMGIDFEKARAWKESGFDENQSYYHREYIPSIAAKARDVIVDPDPTDKPAWHSWQSLQLISQLKGFMTVFTNRVMRGQKERYSRLTPGAANRELLLRVAPYTTMYLLGQIAVGGLRELIQSGEVDDEKGLAQRTWQAFGYLGGVSYFVDPVNAMLWRRDALVSVAGPAPSIAMGLGGATVRSIAELDPDQLVKEVVKVAIPNLPSSKAIEEVIIEGLTDNGS